MYLSKVFKVVLLLSLIALVIPLTIAHGQVTVGTATIEESSTGASDMLAVNLSGLPNPGEGMAYEGWLVSADGENKLSVGVFELDDNGDVDHSYTHPDGMNLATGYSQFLVTVEPSPDTDPAPSGVIAYHDMIPEDGIMYVHGLLDSDSGATVGLVGQTKLAVTHAQLATEAKSIEGVQSHVSHVINIIEGAEGENFDDGHANPGDGMGIAAHASDAAGKAQGAVTAVPTHPNFHTYSGQVVSSTNNVTSWTSMARDAAMTAKSASDMVTARAYATNAHTLATRALNGWDKDRDGMVGTREGEGGAMQAHMAAQAMASYNAMIGPPPEPEPEFMYETCEEAEAAGEERVAGGVGEGLGFPVGLVNVVDADDDGVTCEVSPPPPPPTPTPDPTPDPTPEPEMPDTGDINFATLALIALGGGAVLIVGGATLLRRSRAQA